MIPGTFQNAKANRYDLNDLLAVKLKQKKYAVLFENKMSWPKDALDHPCNILNAELIDVSNMFKNKIQLKLVDCNGKEISSLEGKSMIKDFEPGMRDALEIAMKNISPSNSENSKGVAPEKSAPLTPDKIQEAKQKATEIVEKVDLSKLTEKIEAKTEKKIEVYSNGKLILSKLSISNGEFILANSDTYAPFGIFKPTSQKDTYRVQLEDKSTTIGYLENGNIVVELPNSDGSFRKEVFVKK